VLTQMTSCGQVVSTRAEWVTLSTCQVAKAKRIGSAAAKCSNQADLHSTFIDPIWAL
jgi:hypothetical protein